jgi:hypothetical protein
LRADLNYFGLYGGFAMGKGYALYMAILVAAAVLLFALFRHVF